MRECGDFERGLTLLSLAQEKAGRYATIRDQIRVALWRGVLNKNLMQDAIQYRWNPEAGRFVPDLKDLGLYRAQAEQAFDQALVLGARLPDDLAAKTDLTQVHSEMAETALWCAICLPGVIEEADRRLIEFSRMMSLAPLLEQRVEYHRYCAQRAALDSRFAEARMELDKALEIAREHRMMFLQTDCDMDWARFLANTTQTIAQETLGMARDDTMRAKAYYRAQLGAGTYYEKIADLLIEALSHKLSESLAGGIER
jgi:hypothetical protein